MKIYVDLDHVDITEYTQVESGEYNTNKINFIFTPEYKDLVKVAIFGCKLDTDEPKFYKIYLSDDSCYLPSEVTAASDVISIGVYAFNVENGELKLRYSPTPVKTIVYEGSFREEAENASSPTPTEIEQIMSRIISLEELIQDLDTRVEALENKACDLDSIKEDVNELKNNVESISGRLDTAESDIDELEGDIANTYSKTEVDTLLGSKVDTSTYNSGQAAQDEKIAKAELILSQLPKVTGEGTNISLSPTIEYDLDINEYKGDIYQNTTTGKNKLSPAEAFTNTTNGITYTSNGNGGYAVKGTSTGNADSNTYDIDDYTIQNGDYLHFFNTGNSFQSAFVMKCSDNSFISISFGNTNNRIVDLSSNAGKTITSIYFHTNSGNTLDVEFTPMICNLSSATSFEPYCGGIPSPNPNYPQDIQVVTGTQEVEVFGKNIFNPSNIEIGNISTSTGEPSVTSGSYLRTSNFIKVEGGNTYAFQYVTSAEGQIVIYKYDENKNYITYKALSGLSGTNAMASDVAYIKLRFLTTSQDITTVSKIEVSKDSTVPTYEPYTSQTYTLHLGDLELAKIGTYQDKIYYDNGKWYKTTTIPETTLTSDMCSSVTASASYGALCYLNFNGKVDNSNICAMSNKFVGVSYDNRTSLPTGYRIFTSDGSGAVTIRFPNNSTIDTLQEVKDFVDNNVIKVKYVSQNASTTEITNETLLQDLNYIKEHAMSYSGTTNISTSGNLPIIISGSALKQLS